ncbi:TPA: hypothetical protein MD371_000417 [Klebsiella pneumoniae]|nr:hypothetical protein [Klebsiella pneumoniae]
MKERGMIFNGEMVRALLDGRKTQTRRIIKDCTVGSDQISKFIQIEKKFIGCYPEDVPELIRECCPYGVPGDRIWVREAFRVHSRATDVATLVYKASERNSWTEQTHRVPVAVCNKPATPEKWTPSLHMPRWASRILLEITDVRVERLNAISEEDATAEGVPPAGSLLPDYPGTFLTPKGDFATAKVAFQRLWESIYGEESWKANGWVWVISFKRVEGGAA